MNTLLVGGRASASSLVATLITWIWFAISPQHKTFATITDNSLSIEQVIIQHDFDGGGMTRSRTIVRYKGPTKESLDKVRIRINGTAELLPLRKRKLLSWYSVGQDRADGSVYAMAQEDVFEFSFCLPIMIFGILSLAWLILLIRIRHVRKFSSRGFTAIHLGLTDSLEK